MSSNKLKDYGNKVFREVIGYEPISSSIKPVHIANGLSRLVLGRSYNIDHLNTWSKRYRQGKEVMTSGEIRDKYQAIIDNSVTDEEINKIRHSLELIFDADNSVTPSIKFSTLTISSMTHVTDKVQNEYNIPNFLMKILSAKINGDVSKCIPLLKDHLQNEQDELSRIAKPIVDYDSRSRSVDFEETNTTLGEVELRIRHAFDILAENEKMSFSQNKLLSLERIVLFSCFAIILHLSSKALDLSNNYDKNDRFPIIFDADGTLESIKFASQESLALARLGIEQFFEKSLEVILIKEGYNKYTHQETLKRIQEIPIADGQRKKNKEAEEDKRKNYEKLYLGFYEQNKNAFDSIVKATRFWLFAEYTTDPSQFISSFGGRIGLLAPRAGGRGRKRFSPDPLILEVILLATLKNNKTVSLSEFGEILWDKFGIIIGANPDKDFNYLKKWNISQNTPGDLAGNLIANAEKIADLYISMGYGKRYADGVTVLSAKGGMK